MLLEVKGITKRFRAEQVLQDLHFSLEAHHTLSILGQSGSGKTTMLKILAGLESPDAGEVWLNGELLTSRQAGQSGVVYLYQEDLLFPHLDVVGNIGFGLSLRKVPKQELSERVHDMIRRLELVGQEHKMPHQLSGGQRQRVSFGRAIITNPRLLLLDEPFGSLDTGTRQRMQQLFQHLAAEFRITSLFVTHDLKEALLMGDQLGLMRQGRLKVYASKADFMQDPETGVQSEQAFWTSMGAGNE